jgi:hypothetical protein
MEPSLGCLVDRDYSSGSGIALRNCESGSGEPASPIASPLLLPFLSAEFAFYLLLQFLDACHILVHG